MLRRANTHTAAHQEPQPVQSHTRDMGGSGRAPRRPCRDANLDPRAATSAVYLFVDDADALYAEWRFVANSSHRPTPTRDCARAHTPIATAARALRLTSDPTSTSC